MPELPEVETVKKSLRELVLNKEISEVVIHYDRIIQTDVNEFKTKLVGQKINGIERVGKFLVFILDENIILSHLRMEGKYFLKTPFDYLSKHDHVIFKFTDQTELRYNDTRKFGVMYLFNTTSVDEIKKLPPLQKLGYEPGDSNLTKYYLQEKYKNINLPIKQTLLDQSIISGLGNIYADEVLFASRINPYTKAKDLSIEELEKICIASNEIISKAIKLGGTTIKSFVNSHQATGLFQNELLIHAKEFCPVCNKRVTKTFIGGRGTYFCKNCQKKQQTIVAITGSIATGKSTVSKIISSNYPVIDLDLLASNIYENKNLLKKIDETFSGVVVDGKVNRESLGKIIFNDPEKKAQLNRLTHPVILSKMKKEIDKHKDEIIFVDFPLLYEGGYEGMFDYVIVSYVPKNIQLERLQIRDNINQNYALKKIESQIDIEKKKNLADFVVDNSSSIEYTKNRVNEIINRIRGI